MKLLTATEFETRQKEADYIAKVWKMNMERNLQKQVPPAKERDNG